MEDMPDQLIFAMEVTLNGLLNGVMYALVALGFVLIFKASGIFNYAQGVMALFAAMTLVGIQQGRVPFGHLINEIFGTTSTISAGRCRRCRDPADGSGDDRASPGLVQRFVFRISWGRSRSSCSWRRSGWPISSKACRT
jgi:hypothetical protein